MNYIFYFLIVSSIIFGVINHRTQDVVNAILSGADLSVKIAFSLIGIMAFWLGIMRIAEKSGLVKILAKLINPITKRLFNELPEDNPAVGNIALSFSANALGLTNAATPIGLRVMEELQAQNKDKKSASNSMCLFLAMNTAGFQIIPATVIAILVAVGSKNPTEIILPTMIVTSTAFISAIIVAKILQKLWTPQINNTDNESEAVND
ncbi:TPA: nucleoside recognition protein [Candidatus Gastranaerophilales bacterium HUM_9]|nr:MAG TPA: nucleoside recognition protein [Candidatus Gastranaerophilales bacterium HUM_9]HBX34492.1 nucleoside recognition protein [Cyanobacteria bacterium UBA11440]